jgi:type I restriction enzyme M protein
MITGELKNKIDALWKIFWSGGITNPITVAEQMSYLMFIHDLDDKVTAKTAGLRMLGLKGYDNIFEGTFPIDGRNVDKNDFRWSVFKDFEPKRMYETVSKGVFPFIKTLHPDKESAFSKYMEGAVLVIETPVKLSQIVDSMDSIFREMKSSEDPDIRGDFYEYVLSKMATSKTNGQFRTPRHIIRMMVELAKPVPSDIICDPAYGTAGFLVGACEYLLENYRDEILFDDEKRAHFNNTMFTGFDTDRTMLRIGAMNMMLHGVENPNIQYMDSLSTSNEIEGKFSLILANPPFTGSIDKSIIAPSLKDAVNSQKTELLFLALFIRMLKIGGRAVVIVPEGVLVRKEKAYLAVRKMIIEDNELQAVISMPSGVFRRYSGVSTAVLIFTKTGAGGTDDVWFYGMENDGYSLNDKREPIDKNDIPDILARYGKLNEEKSRSRKEKSFMVPKKEIAENDYDLSISTYRKKEYVTPEYPPTKQILSEIRELNKELEKNLNDLEKML